MEAYMTIAQLIAALSQEPFDRPAMMRVDDDDVHEVRRVDVDSHTGGVILVSERRETEDERCPSMI